GAAYARQECDEQKRQSGPYSSARPGRLREVERSSFGVHDRPRARTGAGALGGPYRIIVRTPARDSKSATDSVQITLLLGFLAGRTRDGPIYSPTRPDLMTAT